MRKERIEETIALPSSGDNDVKSGCTRETHCNYFVTFSLPLARASALVPLEKYKKKREEGLMTRKPFGTRWMPLPHRLRLA